jgi:hypothetical protein
MTTKLDPDCGAQQLVAKTNMHCFVLTKPRRDVFFVTQDTIALSKQPSPCRRDLSTMTAARKRGLMRTLQMDHVTVFMEEQLSCSAMHHQRDKEVSEMLWKVVGGWLLSFLSSHHGMDINGPCLSIPSSKRVMIQINAAASMQQSSSSLVLQEIKSTNTRGHGGDCIPSWSI